MNFSDLGLISPILKALKEKGYKSPTPVQQQSIPIILERNDLLGIAQTGTGKTAAFCIPIIQLIQTLDAERLHKNKLRALILTPTRELAIQINDSLKDYSKHTKLRHTAIFGGVNQNPQVSKLKKGVHILVATPGRLHDLINQGYVHLDDIAMFVLDEADRMLDMGFIHDINRLITLLPRKRQSLFFSATMPDSILSLSRKILFRPKKVEVLSKTNAADTVKQYAYYTERQNKTDLLKHIIDTEGLYQVLIFTRTKHGADKLARRLGKQNMRVATIHGNKTQNQRQKALQQFKQGKIDFLVATDIAARGIDIAKLACVINFDIPNEPESYVHRIGRSGRAGEQGIAISLCEPEEIGFMRAINKLVKKSIITIDDHPFPQTSKPMTTGEKKEWNRKKQEKRQEFFASRKKSNGKNKSKRNFSKKRKDKARSSSQNRKNR